MERQIKYFATCLELILTKQENSLALMKKNDYILILNNIFVIMNVIKERKK